MHSCHRRWQFGCKKRFRWKLFLCDIWGLRDALDFEIFEAAQREGKGLVIMTKGSDFVDSVCRLGQLPQVTWPTCGNVTDRNLRRLLSDTFEQALAELEKGESIVEIA